MEPGVFIFVYDLSGSNVEYLQNADTSSTATWLTYMPDFRWKVTSSSPNLIAGNSVSIEITMEALVSFAGTIVT